MNWSPAKTLLRWHSKKFGTLEAVHERGVLTDGKTPVFKLSVRDSEKTTHSSITYRPHLGRRDLLYVSNVFTKPRSRQFGMAGSLFSLLCAMEKKKLFIIPEKIAKRKKIYEQCGFREGVIRAGKSEYRGLVLDRQSDLKPQDWVKKDAQGKRIRKFFIAKTGKKGETT